MSLAILLKPKVGCRVTLFSVQLGSLLAAAPYNLTQTPENIFHLKIPRRNSGETPDTTIARNFLDILGQSEEVSSSRVCCKPFALLRHCWLLLLSCHLGLPCPVASQSSSGAAHGVLASRARCMRSFGGSFSTCKGTNMQERPSSNC